MGRARESGAARAARRRADLGPRRRSRRADRKGEPLTLRRALARGLVALATLSACKLNPDPDEVVAIEVILPDSARVEVTDSYLPRARALNGAGDSVAAPVFWASLNPAIIEVLDSTTGLSLANAVGTGRLQARVEAIRTAPQDVTVLSHLDSLAASGPTTRDSVVAPDSVSNGLSVQATATGGEAANRRVVYAMTVYPATGSTVTFVPNDTVFTSSLGVASVQVKYLAGTLPDSVVVAASMRRPDGTPIPGSPVTFVVEFVP